MNNEFKWPDTPFFVSDIMGTLLIAYGVNEHQNIARAHRADGAGVEMHITLEHLEQETVKPIFVEKETLAGKFLRQAKEEKTLNKLDATFANMGISPSCLMSCENKGHVCKGGDKCIREAEERFGKLDTLVNMLHPDDKKTLEDLGEKVIKEELLRDGILQSNKLVLPLRPGHPLVIFANSIRALYGHPIYIVGSQVTGATNPHDVDIVVALPDDLFALRFGNVESWTREGLTGLYTEGVRWRWSDECIKRSKRAMQESGYVVDFKVQPMSVWRGYKNVHKAFPPYQLDTRGKL